MRKKLILFPFNGNAIEALDCIDDSWEVIGFVDDNIEKIGLFYNSLKVFNRDLIYQNEDSYILAVPGSPSSYTQRKEFINGLEIPFSRFATIIHPKSFVSNFTNIGYNTLIMAGTVITSNANIGNHVVILPNSVIHHDSLIGDFTLIGSSVCIAGHTEIGSNCYIGSGSNIINNISIGENSLVGMGTNVTKSFEKNKKIIGNPAREI